MAHSNPAFSLPLDLANAPDIDGGGRPANSETVQHLAELLAAAQVGGWDSIMVMWRTPDGAVTWEAWGNWNWYHLAGRLMRAVRKLTE